MLRIKVHGMRCLRRNDLKGGGVHAAKNACDTVSHRARQMSQIKGHGAKSLRRNGSKDGYVHDAQNAWDALSHRERRMS